MKSEITSRGGRHSMGKKRKRVAQAEHTGSHFTKKKQAPRDSKESPSPSAKKLSVINDEWQTCLKSWEDIAPLFQSYRKKKIWMPFYYDGECAKHLRSLGFKDVYHKKQDFFQKLSDTAFVQSVDLIWDNPPYTGANLKERVLRALVKTSKPFVMLLPSSILHSKLLQDIADPSLIQCIIPRRVLVRKTGQNTVPFKYLVWLCYRTSLPRDLLFV
uniref:Uncharacterized protein n=1 Tax=Lotharella oceanica TaxID=641309 RepID=A0A7S2X8N7_9EUKA